MPIAIGHDQVQERQLGDPQEIRYHSEPILYICPGDCYINMDSSVIILHSKVKVLALQSLRD